MYQNRKKKQKGNTDFDEQIKAAKYARIYQTLKDILKTEIKTANGAGKETPDYAATCSTIKTMARLALDFVGDLSAEDE